ncbi:MAG: hypothetical protein AAF513_18485 [Pseudomonadota bacterium]
MLKLVILNGVSGTGKTSTARELHAQHPQFTWLHPDGLWDTPAMAPEDIFVRVVEALHGVDSYAVVDCQIRPSIIAELLAPLSLDSWLCVLHRCPRSIWEARLIDRGWRDFPAEQIAEWASMLMQESVGPEFLTVDTARHTTADVCAGIMQRLAATG